MKIFDPYIYAKIIYPDGKREETYVLSYREIPITGEIIYIVSGMIPIWPNTNNYGENGAKIYAHKKGRGKKQVFWEKPLPDSIYDPEFTLKMLCMSPIRRD